METKILGNAVRSNDVRCPVSLLIEAGLGIFYLFHETSLQHKPNLKHKSFKHKEL